MIIQLFLLAHLESSVQLKGERTIVDKDDKSALPEASSTSHKRNTVKPCVVPGVEASTSKESKLGKESANDSNTLSESKEQLLFADRKWKRKQKTVVSKVNTIYSFNVLSNRFYFVCLVCLIISQKQFCTQKAFSFTMSTCLGMQKNYFSNFMIFI